tara:strand:+ start:1049 stop:1306 length:258 start_codon:yes stop_codon:yes gene_type:complete
MKEFIAVIGILIGVGGIINETIKLEQEIKRLNGVIIQKDKSIVEIKKTSYNRFILAKDLTEICNKYKSSREAKFQYNLKSKIIIN